MVWSPRCPVFRKDDGDLLDEPHLATFITSPAPNAGAAGDTRPDELPQIRDVLRQRAEYVLALAASHGYKRLVLGAWGCGVFRNDPQLVANGLHITFGTPGTVILSRSFSRCLTGRHLATLVERLSRHLSKSPVQKRRIDGNCPTFEPARIAHLLCASSSSVDFLRQIG